VPPTQVALAHEYLTQRGGAERVVEMMVRAFPGAPLYTSLYDEQGTFPEFRSVDIRTCGINRFPTLRRHHRLAFPLLARSVSRTEIDASVVLASSSGWAHGFRTTGRKVVYCHAPARWLYQADRYLGEGKESDLPQRLRTRSATLALAALGGRLRTWDQTAAGSADRYLVNSTVIQRAVKQTYGIDAEVLAPPPALLPSGPERPVVGVDGPFLLCVARLLPYKNVDAVIEAVLGTDSGDLVVVGEGPDRERLEGLAGGSPRIHLVGRIEDPELRWLYQNCRGLVAASYEDYGLSPLEAAAFGKPSVTLRDGGFLDTVRESVTGVHFAAPTADAISGGIKALDEHDWDVEVLVEHAASFAEERFVARLREVVDQELSVA